MGAQSEHEVVLIVKNKLLPLQRTYRGTYEFSLFGDSRIDIKLTRDGVFRKQYKESSLYFGKSLLQNLVKMEVFFRGNSSSMDYIYIELDVENNTFSYFFDDFNIESSLYKHVNFFEREYLNYIRISVSIDPKTGSISRKIFPDFKYDIVPIDAS